MKTLQKNETSEKLSIIIYYFKIFFFLKCYMKFRFVNSQQHEDKAALMGSERLLWDQSDSYGIRAPPMKGQHDRTGIFFMICICVFLSERLNKVCGENWRHFATQNYIDKKGLFSGIFFSGPYRFHSIN